MINNQVKSLISVFEKQNTNKNLYYKVTTVANDKGLFDGISIHHRQHDTFIHPCMTTQDVINGLFNGDSV